MMNRNFRRFGFLMAPLVLAACGGSEAADVRREVPAASPSSPQGAAEALVPSGEAVPDAAPPVAVADIAAPADSGGGVPPVGPAAPLSEPDGAKQLPAAPGAAKAEDDAAADAILERVERTYAGVRSMQADFVQDLRVPLLGTSQRSSGKIYQRRPDRFLMKFSDPAGDVIVADGRSFWMYYPSSDAKQVMKTSIAEGSQHVDLHQQFLSNPVERYNATLDGTESVDGHRTHVLTLLPKQASPVRKLRIWVDTGDFAVRRFEMTEENESVRRIELRNLRRNVDLPDGLFVFTPPRGAQVFEQ